MFLAERKTDGKMMAVKALKKLRVIEDDDVEATIVSMASRGCTDMNRP